MKAAPYSKGIEKLLKESETPIGIVRIISQTNQAMIDDLVHELQAIIPETIKYDYVPPSKPGTTIIQGV